MTDQHDTAPVLTFTRSDLAALLAHHADVLAASLRKDATTGLPENHPGVKRAAELLDLHAGHLTAEEKTAGATELLDSVWEFPAWAVAEGLLPAPAAAPPPADRAPSRRAGLRDEIAAAIWERQNPGRRYADCEHPWQADAEADADQVLALLCREWPWLRAEAEDAAPVDRAAVLTEAADEADSHVEFRGGSSTAAGRALACLAKVLRRLAAEATPEPAGEAHPPRHVWEVESPRRDQWASWGATYDDREWAQDRYESAIENAPARQFRLVRATTAFTVEAEHAPVPEPEGPAVVEPQPDDTQNEPCAGRLCAGSGCSHEQAASALTAHDQGAGLYDAPQAPVSRAHEVFHDDQGQPHCVDDCTGCAAAREARRG